MNRQADSSKRFFGGLSVLAVSAGVACCLHSVRADSHAFSPAYGEQGNLNLRLFTFDGKETTVPLPAPAKVFRDLWFSRSGRAIYGQTMQVLRGQPSSITKVEFEPATQSILRGSTGFEVWHLTESRSSNTVFIAGWAEVMGAPDCGYFEINPDTGGGSDAESRCGCRLPRRARSRIPRW